MIIRIKLTKEKLDQSLFFKGAKGTYIDLTLLENKNGTNEFGDDFMIVQDIPRERREAGEKGLIVGNGRYAGQKPAPAAGAAPAAGRYGQPRSAPAAPPPSAGGTEDVPW